MNRFVDGEPSDVEALRPVTFTSDYGTADEFVGVCHAVMARIAPRVRVIDLSHGVRGVRAGAAVLAQAITYAPADAVHLAVVDPGVGTSRRAVALAAASGALLVGPDNGLLVDAARLLGGVTRAHELTNRRYRLEPVSATFHGRDVFAPAAAHLASGVALEALGEPLDPRTLVRLQPTHVDVRPGLLATEVLRADAFGNLQLAARASDLADAALAGQVVIEAANASIPAVVGRTFADAVPGALVVLVDSAGHVAVAANQASARDMLGSPDVVRVLARHQPSD